MSQIKNGICTVGLDRAGKTVISNYLATGVALRDFKPTLSLNYSNLILNRIKCPYYDAPGQQKLRNTWDRCLKIASFIIYVLDASDSDRFTESMDELTKVLKNPETTHVPLLFLFHKMDLPKAISKRDELGIYFSEDFIKSYGEREIVFFDTSIEHPETIDKVKQYLENHISELSTALSACEDKEMN